MGLSDIAHHYQPRDIGRFYFKVFGTKVYGLWQTIIEPQALPNCVWGIKNCAFNWYRGFFVLALAASILNLDHLRSFSIEAANATSDSGILQEIL